LALNFYIFSACCSGTSTTNFELQVPSESFSAFTTGSSYYISTDIYEGCSEYIYSAETPSGTISQYNLLGFTATSYSSCTDCITSNPCPAQPVVTPSLTSAPTSTPTPSITTTPTLTRTPTVTKTQTRTPTKTPTQTRTQTPTNTQTNTPTKTITPSNTATQTNTPSIPPTNTVTPSVTETPTNTPTNSVTPSITPTNSLQPTPIPTFNYTSSTPTPTSTLTPTITPSPTTITSCTTYSFYVFTNFSATSQYDGIYYNYELIDSSTYDGKSLFYSPSTNAVIYYNSGDTRWCLSDLPGGTCVLFGSTENSSYCPDLNSSFFSSNPPTPSPSTQICDSFDFSALFDCTINPSPTPTPSVTVTPSITPTSTVTPTNYCYGKAIDVSGTSFFYTLITPTPSPTTPNNNRNCVISSTTEFNIFEKSFASSYSRQLTDCSNSLTYIISEALPFGTGATFQATIDNISVCVNYSSDIAENAINILNSIDSGDLFECRFCSPVLSLTPTQTSTITPTITPTKSLTPSNTSCQQFNKDYRFIVGTGLSSNSSIYQILKLSADSYIIIGDFTSYNSSSARGIVKISSVTGIKDDTFNSASGFTAVSPTLFAPSEVIEQPNGKLVCTGFFNAYSGVPVSYICRLNSNGTLDSSAFNTGTSFNNFVFSLGEQSDGKIIVGGNFTDYDGNSVNRICRLDVDGNIDLTFNSGGTGFDNVVFTINVLPDDSIIVGGDFTLYNGNTYNRLIKLNSDGSIDWTFGSNVGFDNQVLTTFVSSVGEIYISGIFTSFAGNPVPNGLVKLTSGGSVDNQFNFNFGTQGLSSGYLKSITEDLNGDILLFPPSGSTLNGWDFGGIVKVSSSGFVNGQIQAYPGFNGTITSSIVDTNNKIVCVGDFSSFNGITSNGIIRLFPCINSNVTPTPTPTPLICPYVINTIIETYQPFSTLDDVNNRFTYVSFTDTTNIFVYDSNLVLSNVINTSDYNSFMLFNYNHNLMYFTQTSLDTILGYDSVNQNLLYTISLTPGSNPSSLAYDSSLNQIFSVNTGNNSISVIDYELGYYTDVSITGSCVNGRIAVDNNSTSYVTDASGVYTDVYIIDAYSNVTYLSAGTGNNVDVLYNPIDNLIYVLDANAIQLIRINCSTLSVLDTYTLSASSVISMTYDNFLNKIYINSNDSTELIIFNCYINDVVTTVGNINMVSGTTSQINFEKYNGYIWYLNSSTKDIKLLCTDHTPIPTPTNTPTPTLTPTSTKTPTPTLTQTPTVTPTLTNTPTPSTTPIPPLNLINTFSTSISTFDSVANSNQIFAFGQTGSTATTFVYSASSPYSAITNFSGITGSSSVTASITNTHIYKAPHGSSFIEVIDILTYTSTTLNISGFSGNNDSNKSSYDSSTGKVAILPLVGSSILFIDANTQSLSSEIPLSPLSGYKGGITTDNNGNFFVVGIEGKLVILNSSAETVVSTTNISGITEYQTVTYDSVNDRLYIYSAPNNVYVYNYSSGTVTYNTSIDVSSYSANSQSQQASIVYNPDNQMVYLAVVDLSYNLIIVKINTSTNTVVTSKNDYGFTLGSSVVLKYNSNIGLILTVGTSSFYLLQP
jgi:uncharacterized delta-60 repeat protein